MKIVVNIDSLSPAYYFEVTSTLRERGLHFKYKKLRIPPAFGFLYWFLTGKSFREQGIFFDYLFKEDGPYGFLPKISSILPFQSYLNRAIKFLLSTFNRKLSFPPSTPLSMLFRLQQDPRILALRKELPKLFSERYGAEEAIMIAVEPGWLKSLGKELKEILKSRDTVLFINYHRLDIIGHLYGPLSSDYRLYLQKILEELPLLLEEFSPEVFEVLSDHGMYQVKKYIDPYRELLRYLSPNTAFIIHTPFLRLKFRSKKDQKKAEEILKSWEEMGYGKIIPGEVLDELSLPWKPSYGDLGFWLYRGFGFLPDFFWGYKKYRGMHHYCGWETGLYLQIR